MRAYYNEIEPYCTAWLQNLMDAREIASGKIDDRSILDVAPKDLAGYDRCHFFAGIAGWDYALRLAQWPVAYPVWTGSCPCQPFSSAGRGGGGADERHLWPAWFWLIRQCRPPIIFGEQVASKAGLAWLDVVFSDLEAAGYDCGAVDLCAAGLGAPHIRQRLWFVAMDDSESKRWGRWNNGDKTSKKRKIQIAGRSSSPWANLTWLPCQDGKWRPTGIVGNSDSNGRRTRASRNLVNDPMQSTQCGLGERETTKRKDNPGFTGEPRPTQPFIQPLAHGVPQRVGRLRAYGNAIVPQVAATFIQAVMTILADMTNPPPQEHK